MTWRWKEEGSFVGQTLTFPRPRLENFWHFLRKCFPRILIKRTAQDRCWEFIRTCLYTKVTKAASKSSLWSQFTVRLPSRPANAPWNCCPPGSNAHSRRAPLERVLAGTNTAGVCRPVRSQRLHRRRCSTLSAFPWLEPTSQNEEGRREAGDRGCPLCPGPEPEIQEGFGAH